MGSKRSIFRLHDLHRNNKERIKTGKSTLTISRLICPKCGNLGELKLRLRPSGSYEYIDHYNGNSYKKSNYKNCCYFGRFDRNV